MELNLALIHEAIAAAVPDRECIVWRDRRLTWATVTERTRRLANLLLEHGLGRREEARVLDAAVDRALETTPTPDLGGSATTDEFTDAVLASA